LWKQEQTASKKEQELASRNKNVVVPCEKCVVLFLLLEKNGFSLIFEIEKR
jgi:hypothetical protein